MKNFYFPLTAFAFLLVLNVHSQVKRCATMELYDFHLQQNPSLSHIKDQMEMEGKKWKENNNIKKNEAALLTIPVVFHVIYNVDSPQQNIPDSVIFSQIDVLNEGFRRLNPDTDDVRAVFDSLSTDINIEFCLATTDPSGNPTSGITRTSNNIASFEFLYSQQDDMKFTSTGGRDAWPKDSYLNIWTCYMTIFNSPGVLGYSHFPWDTAVSTDGVVLLYNSIGRNNQVFDMASGDGKTATHEVGHWMGLFHTWGNESWVKGCDSSDYVDDTPNQKEESKFDCDKIINSCPNELAYWGAENPPDMVENYMDYSNDSCMCMFTKGQKERMLSFLYTSRSGLFNSTGCSLNSSIAINYNTEQFNIFPNPSQGNLSITYPGNKFFDVEIFNIFGQKVLSEINYRNNQHIYLSDLSPGYYFVKIVNENSETYMPLILSAK